MSSSFRFYFSPVTCCFAGTVVSKGADLLYFFLKKITRTKDKIAMMEAKLRQMERAKDVESGGIGLPAKPAASTSGGNAHRPSLPLPPQTTSTNRAFCSGDLPSLPLLRSSGEGKGLLTKSPGVGQKGKSPIVGVKIGKVKVKEKEETQTNEGDSVEQT